MLIIFSPYLQMQGRNQMIGSS